MITDIVVGLSYGDEGKGKVTHHLLKPATPFIIMGGSL